MTDKPDLPINDAVPAPTKIEPGNLFLWNWRQMQVYAQACVAHAVAPLQAEVEALRSEVRRANSWNERVSVCRDHVADIVDGPCVICALSAAEARAGRLAEALRNIAAMRWSSGEDLMDAAGAARAAIEEAERLRGVIARYERKLDAAIDQARGKGVA